MFCVYRFKDKEGKVIYIGRTVNLHDRLQNQHFTLRGHLSQECYDEVDKVEYANLSSKSEMKIYELYLINKYTPKYNVQDSNRDKFSFLLPDIEWLAFTGEKNATQLEEVNGLEKRVKKLRKVTKRLREEKRVAQEEADSLLVMATQSARVLDYVLGRANVDYDKDDLVRLILNIGYISESVLRGGTETRQEYYKKKRYGEVSIDKILWSMEGRG